MNERINQSVSQPTNQPTNHLNIHPIDQLTYSLVEGVAGSDKLGAVFLCKSLDIIALATRETFLETFEEFAVPFSGQSYTSLVYSCIHTKHLKAKKYKDCVI
jgi:hypothetical protein